jgi:phenylpropionate dioxygenase-like ring-hydroxylating dioxygenase large terminal subunit
MPRGETASLLPEAYYSQEWHAREQTAVFGRNWLYVGTLAELSEPGSWITVENCGRSWIVARTEAGLRCFRNVCSHRHSRILEGERGCGPIRCGYHGWTYDAEGVPTGLPGQRDNFDLNPTERLALRLPPGRVASVANFVFMAEDPTGSRPEDDMNPLAVDLLHKLSDTFLRPYVTGDLLWDSNWKASVEVTLEPYHAPFVHANGFAEAIEIDGEIVTNPHFSSEYHRLKDKSRRFWKAMTDAADLKPSGHFEQYWHFHIHPNVCISVTYGCALLIQTFNPVSPDRTRLRYRLFLPEVDSVERHARRTALESVLTEFTERVMAEDQGAVEACQRGFRNATSRALLGKSEARIGNFQRGILTDLDHKRGPDRSLKHGDVLT